MHENRETSETPAAPSGSRSAGEGSGHTARVYVIEESHCGIVPMNHSNKDGTLVGGEWGGKAADQGEHSSFDRYPTQSGTARVPRVGECADKFTWPLFIRDKNRMR
jgi:FlaG/FlaF family flagellin (archaellin)